MLWYDLCSATDILIIVILTISSSHWVFSEHIVWWNIIQLNRAQSSIQKFERTVITLRKYIHNYISTYFLYCHCFTSEIFAFKRRYNWTNKCPIICGLWSLKHHTMIYVRDFFNIKHSILEDIWQSKILFSYNFKETLIYNPKENTINQNNHFVRNKFYSWVFQS